MKQTIQEYLGVPKTWKIKENIKHAILLMPNASDIKNAKARDPMGCAPHNAACRMYDIPNAAIGGRWAYIPQRNSKGGYYIARMQATSATQKAWAEGKVGGNQEPRGKQTNRRLKTRTIPMNVRTAA